MTGEPLGRPLLIPRAPLNEPRVRQEGASSPTARQDRDRRERRRRRRKTGEGARKGRRGGRGSGGHRDEEAGREDPRGVRPTGATRAPSERRRPPLTDHPSRWTTAPGRARDPFPPLNLVRQVEPNQGCGTTCRGPGPDGTDEASRSRRS